MNISQELKTELNKYCLRHEASIKELYEYKEDFNYSLSEAIKNEKRENPFFEIEDAEQLADNIFCRIWNM